MLQKLQYQGRKNVSDIQHLNLMELFDMKIAPQKQIGRAYTFRDPCPHGQR